jgi:hypothetical protein
MQLENVFVTAGIETLPPKYVAGFSTALDGSAEYYRIVLEKHNGKYMRLPSNV